MSTEPTSSNGLYDGIVNHKLRIAAGFKLIDVDTNQYKNYLNPETGTWGPIVNTKSTDIFMPNENRRLFFLSLQDEWQLAKGLGLTAGVRGDNYDD